jgi:hypothetical protein
MAQVSRTTLKGYGDAGDILTNAQWINICDSFALVSELGGGGGGGGVSSVLVSVSTISAYCSYSGNAPVPTEVGSNEWRFTLDNTSVLVSVDMEVDVSDLNASNELVVYLKSDSGHVWRPKGIEFYDKVTDQKFTDASISANGVSIKTEISAAGETKTTVTNANVFTNGIRFCFAV